ncbi:MAG TPA: glycosyltransferase [Acidobacteriota bacterium]|nr:glycosyltransferase [Acidobacteriota bacterium]
MRSEAISVCYVPGREATYIRTRVLTRGMQQAGLVVRDCSSAHRSALRYLIVFANFLRYRNRCNLVFVGFMGQPLVPLIKLFTRKAVVLDAYLSTYQTLVYDRKRIRPNGLLAKFVKSVERLSCRLSDHVLLDTNQHIEYFLKLYQLEPSRFSRSFVGADDSVLKPCPSPNNTTPLVHFHGGFQQLHGAPYIVEAASLLPAVRFRLVGSGPELSYCQELARKLELNNVEFVSPVSLEVLAEYVAESDICLGIFSESQKAQLVIPCKVFEALAMKKPVVTADTPAARELLTHMSDAYLCRVAEPASLAAAIGQLVSDDALRVQLAENGYRLFLEQCSPAVIGGEVRSVVEQVIDKRLTGKTAHVC